jgi:hypothetical protein
MNRTLSHRKRAFLMACAAIVPALVATSAVAGAVWSTSGTGAGAGAAYVMPTGSQPSERATPTQVVVSWAPVTLSGGQAVAGYVVARTNAVTGGQSPAGGACSGVVTTTSCVETGVPAGSWIYTDTPVIHSWTGPTSPGSAPVTAP